ncbi:MULTISPECIES: helix-turn-helix domain-containing protein [Streptomyces]|uniref:Helix-turn-helix domain-containing protein n=1 Tax=Streptomyces doudnae TaxID=3075536 RepID=A0ABD5EM14_9ACTN|nr:MULTISPECIES: helix-turn-helix domain-containing protein [unclassified Streptomyces]MDT0434799.1 helix-turn-helix domain-containing protein [Streptomyces sp. DSM 41981]MYQ68845.1 transcriptional regulator [Streptomyces sp. SID4950]SCE49480.1 transcriptional regulator, HxlR family [Streptomyces sp. SolWspMP-5a-2]
MSGFRPGERFLADCPARLAVELLADKWAAVVLYGLSEGPVRHGDLAELIGGISRKVLTQTLRRLEAHGLVSRHAYAEVPPRVEYGLTPLGATLIDPILMLTEWARTNGEAVLDALDARAEPLAPGD